MIIEDTLLLIHPLLSHYNFFFFKIKCVLLRLLILNDSTNYLVNEIITINFLEVCKFSLNGDLIHFSITFIKEKHFSFEIQQRCVARNSEVEFLEKMKEMDDCNLLKKEVLRKRRKKSSK